MGKKGFYWCLPSFTLRERGSAFHVCLKTTVGCPDVYHCSVLITAALHSDSVSSPVIYPPDIFSCSLLSSAGFSHLGSRGAEHSWCGASWFPAAASGQSLSSGVWRTKVRPGTHSHTGRLIPSFSSSSSFHSFIVIFPQFPTLVGEGLSSSRKSDSVSLSLFSICIFNFPKVTTSPLPCSSKHLY